MNFDKIIEKVLEHEGGYVNDPDDLGGETNYGITKRFFPDVDIKNLTKEQAKKIYHQDYWRPAKCDEVPNHLKHIYFDMCVNFGEMDFASSDPMEITATLRYDYAVLQF